MTKTGLQPGSLLRCEVDDWFEVCIILGTDGEGEYLCLHKDNVGVRYLEASSYTHA